MTMHAATAENTPVALAENALNMADGTASDFFQEIVSSAHRRLALSTVARLMQARETASQSRVWTPAVLTSNREGVYNNALPQQHQLDYQIDDLRHCLRRIEASALSHRTKSLVTSRIAEQLELLQIRRDALPHCTPE